MPATRRAAPLAAVLLYAAFAAWLTWPALANLGTAVPGSDGDAFVHLWTFNWARDALLGGFSPFFTTRLFFPEGVLLYTHNFAWLNIALWLPLQAFFGGAAAYTLGFLLVLVLNGTAVFFLVRDLTGQDGAALLAGFIAAGWPYIVSRHSQPNLIFIAFVPVALLFLRRVARDGRWPDALALAAAVAAIGYSRLQLLLLSAPLLLAAGLYWLAGVPRPRRRRALAQMTAAALLGGLLLAPAAAPVLRFQLTRAHAADIIPDEEPWGEADLLGFFLPGPAAPGGDLVSARLPGLLTRTPIGWATLLLAALGLLAPRRDKWLWLGLAGLILLLALGRTLTINGRATLPLPYGWLEQHIGLVQLIRYPSRFTALLAVPVAVLAGYGAAWLAARLSARAFAATAVLLLLLIALEDRAAPYPLLPLQTPAWYAALPAAAADEGLLAVPFSRGFAEYAMVDQLTHGRGLLYGHVSRPPREAFSFIAETPFLAALRERVTTPPPEMGDIAAQLAPLAAAGVPQIAIHKRFLAPAETSAWRLWFGIPPAHEDDELLVYPTAMQVGRDFSAQPSGLPGVGFVAGQIAAPGAAGEAPAAVAHWALDAGAATDWQGCVTLRRDGADAAESCALLILPVPGAGAARLARTAQPLVFDPPPGDGRYEAYYTLRGRGAQSAPLPLGPFYAAATGRQFALPPMETETAVAFGDAFSLRGYDGPRLANDVLDLTLFWQAAREMDTSYKIFVHVLDAAGRPAAQLDTVPRDWSYPTNAWQAGEVVSDRLRLPLGNLPPGTYEIRLGAYDPADGARLPPAAADATAVRDDTLLLGTFARPQD